MGGLPIQAMRGKMIHQETDKEETKEPVFGRGTSVVHDGISKFLELLGFCVLRGSDFVG